jgi:hypothetical protein
MSSNNDPNASASIPQPTTPEEGPSDLPIHSTPMAHKLSTAMAVTSGALFRDDTLTALGNEMVGYVVGPMPADKFLKILPQPRKPAKKFNANPFAKLASQTKEAGVYEPFVRIPFSFLHS